EIVGHLPQVVGDSQERVDDRSGGQQHRKQHWKGVTHDGPRPHHRVPHPSRNVLENAPMKTLKGRVAVVTGAASGIGLGMAERFAAEGMRVVLADVEGEALAAAERSVAARGAETLAVRTDVARADDVEALARATIDRFGAVHVLCNNAGVGGEGLPTWEQSLQSWQWILGVNLWGVIHGIHAFLPIMQAQGEEGHIVNTASMAGHLPMPFLTIYNASKFAVVTISECLHHELEMVGSPIKVSVLCPGFVRTKIMESERN